MLSYTQPGYPTTVTRFRLSCRVRVWMTKSVYLPRICFWYDGYVSVVVSAPRPRWSFHDTCLCRGHQSVMTVLSWCLPSLPVCDPCVRVLVFKRVTVYLYVWWLWVCGWFRVARFIVITRFWHTFLGSNSLFELANSLFFPVDWSTLF